MGADTDDAPSAEQVEEMVEDAREEHPSLDDLLMTYRRQRRAYEEVRGRSRTAEGRAAGLHPRYRV